MSTCLYESKPTQLDDLLIKLILAGNSPNIYWLLIKNKWEGSVDNKREMHFIQQSRNVGIHQT